MIFNLPVADLTFYWVIFNWESSASLKDSSTRVDRKIIIEIYNA